MSGGRHQQVERRRLPAWLLGLILAVVLFAVGVLVFSALGFGDDPVVEEGAANALSGLHVLGL